MMDNDAGGLALQLVVVALVVSQNDAFLFDRRPKRLDERSVVTKSQTEQLKMMLLERSNVLAMITRSWSETMTTTAMMIMTAPN